MIHTCIPYSPKAFGKNLGAAYNAFMELLHDDDWACFLDHDAMFTTVDWYPQLEAIIESLPSRYPDAGLLTACTNRIGNDEQVVFRKSSREAMDHDIMFHRAVGKARQEEFGRQLRRADNLVSGIVLLLSKKVWKETKGFADGFLKVDIDIDSQIRELGYRTYIMEGVYCYHYYRADTDAAEARGYSATRKLPPVELQNYKRDIRANFINRAEHLAKRIVKNFRSN